MKQLNMKRRSVDIPHTVDAVITARAIARGISWSEVVREGLFFFVEALERDAFYCPPEQIRMRLEEPSGSET